MFTGQMYERLSEWMGNVSVLFLGTLVVPVFAGTPSVGGSAVIKGVTMTLACLWLSLRFSRIAERGRG